MQRAGLRARPTGGNHLTIPDNAKFIVLDTETTGAERADKVCEIGWIVVDQDFNILEERQSLIDPQRMISPSASGIHGLTNDDVADSPTIEEYFSIDDPACYGHRVEEPVVIIGHRISFDVRYVAPYFNIVQEVCTLRWARKLYPDASDHKLSTLMFALGLPRPENAHRVMSDIYSAYHLAKHICERTGASLRELTAASAEPMLVQIMPFGKHKGEAFKDVPRSYLQWMRGTMKDLDGDLLHTINHHLKARSTRS